MQQVEFDKTVNTPIVSEEKKSIALQYVLYLLFSPLFWFCFFVFFFTFIFIIGSSSGASCSALLSLLLSIGCSTQESRAERLGEEADALLSKGSIVNSTHTHTTVFLSRSIYFYSLHACANRFLRLDFRYTRKKLFRNCTKLSASSLQ